MMNKRKGSYILTFVGLTCMLIVWSEYHAKINKFLTFNQVKDPASVVSAIFISAAIITVIATLVIGYLLKNSKMLFVFVCFTGMATGSAVFFAVDTNLRNIFSWLVLAMPFILLLFSGVFSQKERKFAGRATIAILFLISSIFTLPLNKGPSAWGFEWILAIYVIPAQYLISVIMIIVFSIRANIIKNSGLAREEELQNKLL